jgi:hypothetical protein
MITQAIKRWLNKLFGWLSWRKPPETEYARVGSSLNKGVTQESAAWPTSDGVAPQSGVAPLILGQGETSCSTIDEWPESVIQPPPPTANEELPPAPSGEQKLEFLHYLVKRGIVNEGFTEGQVPEQYRK